MGPKLAPLASWPWEWAETQKYFLYAPLGVQCLLSYHRGDNLLHDAYFHILLLSFLRCCLYQSWHVLSRSYFISKYLRIQDELVNFDQVDREFDWDNYVILQALAASAAQAWAPSLLFELPFMNWKGVFILAVLHMGPCEFLYYCIHRSFHKVVYLYDGYHHLHHASTRPEPSTAGTGTFLEHLLLTALMFLPLAGVMFAGMLSPGIIYTYILGFDLMRFMIHSNVEVMPNGPFEYLPFLRLFLITPSYHSLHHKTGDSNYCLFMPLYDYLGGTLNRTAFKSHESLRKKGSEEVVPQSVFVPHGVDFVSVLHIGLTGRTFSSYPRQHSRWFTYPLVPLLCLGSVPVWFWGKPYVVAHYTLKGMNQQTWSMPTYGFQYFIPSLHKKLNKLLEETILEADKMGVKVLTLGALNKNEAMNGGGVLFVEKFKDLKVRVCHGNTLTTAVLLHELAKDVAEVFLTGSTSKIGKAIALYLCRKRVKVLMLTASADRFDAVVREAPKECKQYLVRATKYQAGQNCKTWIIGKWAGYHAQQRAPPGTHFHQFTLPSIIHFRKDCIYHDSVGIRLPVKLVQGVNSCEHTMPRHVVHACHAGGLLHALEGWQHHEVGAIDVNKLDVVWEAAMKHGFTPV
ncbi:hypothetical protein L7F22_063837 [Adiantum nelumboides]|nr:hypothetical protein [Adiantum nelumboides]